MASINRNRLHLLLSTICGVTVLVFGIYLLIVEHAAFAARDWEGSAA